MFNYLFEPRSDPGYDDDEAPSSGWGWSWRDIFLFPLILFIILLIGAIIPPLMMAAYALKELYGYTAHTLQQGRVPWAVLIGVTLLGVGVWWVIAGKSLAPPPPASRLSVVQTAIPSPTPCPSPCPSPTVSPTPKPTLEIPVVDASVVLGMVAQAQGTCQDQPLASWKLAGEYLYRLVSDDGAEALYTLAYPRRAALPAEAHCQAIPWGFAGELLAAAPTAGYVTSAFLACSYDTEAPYGSASITVVGVETVTTRWGSFEALRVDATRSYHLATINDPHGTLTVSEWYVCGLGLVRADQVREDWYQYRAKQHTAELALVWVAPSP